MKFEYLSVYADITQAIFFPSETQGFSNTAILNKMDIKTEDDQEDEGEEYESVEFTEFSFVVLSREGWEFVNFFPSNDAPYTGYALFKRLLTE